MVVNRRAISICISVILLLSILWINTPTKVSGEVDPITEAEEKLEQITEEEQAVLNQLFLISQNIEIIEREEARITLEIDTYQEQIDGLRKEIAGIQKEYDLNLEILQNVLVSYQKGGPASYLEILLNADSLSSFLKSINLIKDISRNVGELLTTLEVGEEKLTEANDRLEEEVSQLEATRQELKEALAKEEYLKREQELHLEVLQTDRAYYEEQLMNLEQTWDNIQRLFPNIMEEFSRIISEGYLSMDDMDISFNLFSVSGTIEEDTLNAILKKYSNLPEITFHFDNNRVNIEVPDLHLYLTGHFVSEGKTAIKYIVEEGTFYDMVLEQESIRELFDGGALVIDFEEMAGDYIMIDFELMEAICNEGYLSFVIKPIF